MKTYKPYFCLVVACAILAGCSGNGGQKTFAFLKAGRDVLENTKAQLSQCSYPKPPLPPDPKIRMPFKERLAIIRAYHAALKTYLNTVVQDSQQSEHILTDAQTKMSELDSAGVDIDAVNLTKNYENTLGAQFQVRVEVEALAQLDQVKLDTTQQSKNLVDTMIPGIVETCITQNPSFAVKSFVNGISKNLKQDIDRNQEAQTHLGRLEDAVTSLKQDVGATVTERSELVSTYKEKYSRLPWDDILPPESIQNTVAQNN
jgi:hypothetical protein